MTTPSVRTPLLSSRLFPPCRGSRFVIVGLLLCAFSLGCVTAGAALSGLPGEKGHEKPYALIFGTVWGPDDRPVYGVKVKIRRTSDKKARWELYSDHNGEFAQRVPGGAADYVVWADLKGFKSNDGRKFQSAQEVTVHIDNDERADIGLHLK